MKSVADFDNLIHNVIMAEDFSRADLQHFSTKTETARLDALQALATSQAEVPTHNPDILGPSFTSPLASPFQDPSNGEEIKRHLKPQDGWHESDVTIPLPDNQPHPSEAEALKFNVPGLHHRSLVEVIKSAFRSKQALRFHLTPFKQYWVPTSSHVDADEPQPQRIYDELYASDVWIDEHLKLQAEPREDGDELERVETCLVLPSCKSNRSTTQNT